MKIGIALEEIGATSLSSRSVTSGQSALTGLYSKNSPSLAQKLQAANTAAIEARLIYPGGFFGFFNNNNERNASNI